MYICLEPIGFSWAESGTPAIKILQPQPPANSSVARFASAGASRENRECARDILGWELSGIVRVIRLRVPFIVRLVEQKVCRQLFVLITCKVCLDD